MKVRHSRTLKDGRVLVLIELGATEAMPVPPLNDDAFYKLNYPHEEIVQGFHINNPTRVYWETLGQAWREV